MPARSKAYYSKYAKKAESDYSRLQRIVKKEIQKADTGTGEKPQIKTHTALTRTLRPARQAGRPDQKRVTLLYSDFYNLADAVGGVLQNQDFRANGCFDPDVTGVGHQPMGFDTWASQYNHYVVQNSEIKVQITNINTPSAGSVIYGVCRDDDGTISADWRPMVEQNIGTYRMKGGGTGQTIDQRPIFCKYNRYLMHGQKGSASYVQVTSDPTDLTHFMVWAQCIDRASTFTLQVHVTIAYDVIFSEPKYETVVN